jgi:ribosomal protein S18 acetylase RimI-like enzyme
MQIDLRPGCAPDFDYCQRLYFSEMDGIIRELGLDPAAQAASFRETWDWTQVRVIALDGTDVGWLQSFSQGDALFLGQLFVDASFQRRGIGSQVMRRLIAEAAKRGLAVTLGVVKTNTALRLYQRLGFAITHEDERKFYMRRELDAEAPVEN